MEITRPRETGLVDSLGVILRYITDLWYISSFSIHILYWIGLGDVERSGKFIVFNEKCGFHHYLEDHHCLQKASAASESEAEESLYAVR